VLVVVVVVVVVVMVAASNEAWGEKRKLTDTSGEKKK
jgi:hypothetical protein